MSPIYFEDLFISDKLIQLCQGTFHSVVIVTDKNVGPLYASRLQTHFSSHQIKTELITLPAGEQSKSREMKCLIENQLFELGCGRDTCLVALGGGVVTDLTGFVAATFCRGIPVIYLPTSLLAMVDAAIGGKTGINTEYGKNVLGTFTQPKAIMIDTQVLASLPDSEYVLAFSEIIKHALIYDERYFELISSHSEQLKQREPAILKSVIKRSGEIKSEIVEIDEKESGLREILNFGHTIAHALEQVSDYTLSHGQAVSIGLIVESYMSVQMGFMTEDDFQQVRRIIQLYDLPLKIHVGISKECMKHAFFRDKKARQQIPRFVLLEKIGKVVQAEGCYAVSVPNDLLDDAIDYLYKDGRE